LNRFFVIKTTHAKVINMKFVVIGGDAAGMSAASKARRLAGDMDITILEKSQDVSYSACGMPYNIADASRDINDLVVRKAEIFRQKQELNLLTGHCVHAIDPIARSVSGDTSAGKAFTFDYDKLLIATGGSAIRPQIEGIDLPGVMVLKSLDDGRKIKSYLDAHAVRKVVIIGMGYIAMEMAEALTERSIQVTLVKPKPTLLPWLASELSDVVKQELMDNGVGLHPGQPIEKIKYINDHLDVICQDKSLHADMVLIAVGISPNSEIAANAGIKTGPQNAISVDRNMRTSDTHIFAAGDCADAYHVVNNQKVWIPLALRANRAGWAVADNICGNPVQLPGIVGTAVFKVFNLEVARSGLTLSEAAQSGFDPVGLVIKSRSRAHAHPGSGTIHIHMLADKNSGRMLGAQMVGREGVAHRINAVAVALHNHMSLADFAQTDMAYAPPFGPVWDPLLTTANQLLKKL
jgi:NADPH-dependent 2,4-dienoyl-CoA reductase/sulfur reductase-like enzyme